MQLHLRGGGLDGGTIATRTDLLRRSSWRLANNDGGAQRSTRGGQLTAVGALNSAGVERRDIHADAVDAFSNCALSGAALPQRPAAGEIVCCSLGRLQLRTAVVEFLTKHGQFAPDMCDTAALDAACGHITKLRDVFGVTLEPNPRFADPVRASSEYLAQGQGGHEGSGGGPAEGPWICPIDRDCSANGQFRFVALRPCGHVMRERVVLEVARRGGGSSSGGAGSSSSNGAAAASRRVSDGISTIEGGEWACPVCSQAVEVSVLLNASPEVVESVRATLRAERDAKAEKKSKKRARQSAEER